MRYAILFLFALVSLGCATTAKYEAILQTWVGKSETELVNHWGAPASTYSNSDGSKIITYNYDGGSRTVASGNTFTKQVYFDSVSYWCKTSFFADKDSQIYNWRWEGNVCKAK